MTLTPLTLYGSSVASGTLATANAMATTTGGTETTKTTTGPPSGTGYVEFLAQGGTGTLNASLPAQSGKGWLLDSTILEGQTIPTGNWSAIFGAADTAGAGPITSFVIRFSKRSSGGTYTTIGTLTISSTTIATTRTTYTYSASSLSGMEFGIGDKLYIDRFTNATGWSSDPIVDYLSNSATQGVANDMQVNTPGFSPTIIIETVTETATGSEIVVATSLTLNAETVTETATGSETVVSTALNLVTETIIETATGSEIVIAAIVSVMALTETATGSEIVTITTINVSAPSVQMNNNDMAFEHTHIKSSPVGSAVKILADVFYGNATNTQVIYGELDALLQPETISQLHIMKTRNDVLLFIRSYTYMANVLADQPQAYYRLNEASGTTVLDISGRNYPGLISGTVTYAQPGALAISPDTCMTFNGSLGSISFPVTLFPNPNAFSIEFWLNFPNNTSLANFPRLVAQDDAQNNLKGFDIGLFPSGTHGAFFNLAVNGVWKQVASSTVFSIATWYHMVFVFNGTNSYIYTNGVQAASLATSGLLTPSANSIELADMPGSSLSPWVGSLDEVAIYSYALPAARVLAHYNAGINP